MRKLGMLGSVFCLLLVGLAARADIDVRTQMLLGNPDNATASASNKEHYLIQRSQYALSFNETLHFPNWVAWHLSASDIGDVERGAFKPDKELPDGFTQITTRDYTRIGYDRGHNCPSKDRTAKKKDNDAVFLMTNITPQAHGMNAGPWEKLENYCRELAGQGNELFIVCGHGFTARTHDTAGPAQIAVPDFGWKVVVVIPKKSGSDLARITAQARVIAVKMTNINTISKKPWTDFLVTPADIEKATGFKLFTSLPPRVAAALCTKRDAGQ